MEFSRKYRVVQPSDEFFRKVGEAIRDRTFTFEIKDTEAITAFAGHEEKKSFMLYFFAIQNSDSFSLQAQDKFTGDYVTVTVTKEGILVEKMLKGNDFIARNGIAGASARGTVPLIFFRYQVQ